MVEMNTLEKLGRKRTILISISILLVSLHTIYFYHAVFPNAETKKVVQQIIRFLLTIWLLILIYKGTNWARIATIILAVIAVIGTLISIFTLEQELVLKIPLFVMAFVNSMTIYFLGFSKSYKAFAIYQQMKHSKVESLSDQK